MAFAQSHPPRAKYKLNGAQNGTHNGTDAKDEKVFVTTASIGFSHFYLISFFASDYFQNMYHYTVEPQNTTTHGTKKYGRNFGVFDFLKFINTNVNE